MNNNTNKRPADTVNSTSSTKAAKIQIHIRPPCAPEKFAAAFVLPITRDGRALLTRERRAGKGEKLGMLGGKAREGEGVYECMAREAKEESGGALSEVTLLRIGRGAGMLGETTSYYNKGTSPETASIAVRHDMVVSGDWDVDTRFDIKKAADLRTHDKKKEKKPQTVQTGLEFVQLKDICDWKWREKNMHFVASVLCARLMKAAQEASRAAQ